MRSIYFSWDNKLFNVVALLPLSSKSYVFLNSPNTFKIFRETLANLGPCGTRFSAASPTSNKEIIGAMPCFDTIILESIPSCSKPNPFQWMGYRGIPHLVTLMGFWRWVAELQRQTWIHHVYIYYRYIDFFVLDKIVRAMIYRTWN